MLNNLKNFCWKLLVGFFFLMLFHVLSCLLFYVACLLFPRVEMNVCADRSTLEWMPAQSRGSGVISSVR